MTQDDGAITLHEIDVSLAFDVFNEGTLTARDDVGLASNRAECANRRVHSTGD
ncbi:MAG: hypothetical protein RL218_1082, partial [Actinomycetota bacterium]